MQGYPFSGTWEGLNMGHARPVVCRLEEYPKFIHFTGCLLGGPQIRYTLLLLLHP